LLALGAAVLAAASVPPEGGSDATFDRATVPAAGKQSAILTVPRFGRYALTVKSSQGTGLQVVDRMAGPGPIDGSAGERDGRLDVLLERGEYKVLTHGHTKASGEASLAVRTFVEKHALRAPLLVELKPVERTLSDFEQLSYWIEVKDRRTLNFEAAGRSLADLRLWKDGNWLAEPVPTMQVIQPTLGKPLRLCRLAADVEPGLYRLTAYGGPAQPWAEDDGGHPFHLRFGIPYLGVAGRARHTIGPLGTDRFLVAPKANYLRLELPEAGPATLEVGTWDPDNPFAAAEQSAAITKKSLPPVAEIDSASQDEKPHVVTITAAFGQPYTLQHFEVRDEYTFDGDADYWISTVHSGQPEDSADVTGIVTRRRVRTGERPGPIEPFLSETVSLDARTGWARRANLLETLTVFLQVKEAGSYQILSKGAEARFRIEPFLTIRPARYEPPAFQGPGSTWNLDAGFFVLTVEPVKKGILDVAIRPSGLVDFVLEKVGLGRDVPGRPVRPALRFGKVGLESDFSYTLYLNRQPQVRAGVILRRLPLDLTQPLALAQQAGETVTVPFEAREASTLRAEAEDGTLIDLAVDGGAPQQTVAIEAGAHTVTIRSVRDKSALYSLILEPARLQAKTPLPLLPDAALAALPDFPVLTDEAPRSFDLDRGASATFLLRASAPALYRLQSTGLMATEGNVRTRTVTSLARESQNGVGRNFLVQPYLREGDYQLTVSAQGLSTGHLGVGLSRTPLLEGGFITSGLPARISLPAGSAVAYRFAITKPGEFRLRALGRGRDFRFRLEDKDGWPIETPSIAADLTRYYEPGRYRVVILPESTDARVVTAIEPSTRTLRYQAHGPHRLPLARRVDHVWLEPGEGETRAPDVWELNIPAAIDATMELTGEMQGSLLRIGEDGSTSAVAAVPPGRGWKGVLETGRYRLEVTCVRTNNRAPYQVALWPEQLVSGLDREVQAPADVPVSVGQTSVVDLSSFGTADVRARLEDSDGRLVAVSDDRPDDWNFLIARSLTAGKYRLRVNPVGTEKARVTVSMRVPREAEKPGLALPAKADVTLGRTSHLFPLAVTPDGALFLAAARSAESVGLALEALTDDVWRTLGSSTGRNAHLEIPLARSGSGGAWASPSRYRLRLWSLDRRDSPVRLTAAAIPAKRVSEAQLRAGVELTPVAGITPAVGAAAIVLERPGLLRVEGERSALRWSSAHGQPCGEVAGDLLAATGPLAWVVADLPSRPSFPLRATRVTVSPGPGVQIALPAELPVSADVAPSGGGPLLLIASSRTAQPGVRLLEAGATSGPSGIMAPGLGSAVAVTLRPRRPAALVWAASPADEPPEVRLQPWSFAAPERERASGGTFEGSLDGVRARALALDSGPKRVHLALGEGMVAALSKDDEVESVHWAGGPPFVESIETQADRLTLLHIGEGQDRFAIEILPLAEADQEPPLSMGRAHERAHVRAGTQRIRVAATAAPATLHVRGASRESVFVGADGQVARGRDLPVDPGGGTLLVPHGPGWLLAWIDRPGEEAQGLWAEERPAEVVAVKPPASVVLGGEARAFRLEAAEPAMLHLRTAAPAATLLRRAEGVPDVEVHAGGVVRDAYLPAGGAELLLRALAGGTLSGIAEITTTPVTPIGEGLGPEVLLAPGATRLFSFTVARDGPVGVGVRASADVVQTTLLTSAGRSLGSGVVQMTTLTAGTYLLSLHAPEDASPIRARPAIAGLKTPDTGPPEEVIRQYLEPEEAPPSFTATHVETPASEVVEGEAADQEHPLEDIGYDEAIPEEPLEDEGAS
jgi:hypothetical protein